MAGVPQYVWRENLYTVAPELRDVDTQIAKHGLVPGNYDKEEYIFELSKAGTFSNLYSTSNGVSFVNSYITFLEKGIVSLSSNISGDALPLIEQKIQILETIYSNLLQTSTQSVSQQ
jgi:hypothetical protein